MNDVELSRRAPAPAVATAVKLLDALVARGGTATLDELTKAVGEPRSSIHRVLTTLAMADVVTRGDRRGGYRLGPRLVDWGSAFVRTVDLFEEFSQVARPLAHELNETVQLGVLDLPDVVFVANVDSSRAVRLATEVGRRLPAHATAAGKALLAADPSLLDRVDALARLTPRTITSKKELATVFEEIREKGYAVSVQEATENLCCLAAPVHRAEHAVAALSICIAAAGFEPEYLAELVRRLRKAASKLSRRLGASSAPTGAS